MLSEIPECKKEEVTVFNVIKRYPSWAYFPEAQWRHSDGFAIVYPAENGHQIAQVFSFEIMEAGAMERWMGEVDIGGYFFHVFKTHPVPIPIGLLEGKVTKLIGESDQNRSRNRIELGFGHHSSRYQPYAHTEALYYAYLECNWAACEIARDKKIPLIEILHDYLIWELKHAADDYRIPTLYADMNLLVKILEPSFRHKEQELVKDGQ